MKETIEMPADTKAKRPVANVKARTGRKAVTRKASAKRSTAAAAKRSAPVAGYGDAAAKFIAKGKTAFGDAYTWAEEAGSALPRRVRGMGLPNPNTVQHFLVERPLVLGAVGLGIGLALGAMMPSSIASWPAAKNPRRPAKAAKARRK